jgi:hypothetical protein
LRVLLVIHRYKQLWPCFPTVDRKFLNLTEAEFNAWRDKVVESEPELAKQGSEAAGSPE